MTEQVDVRSVLSLVRRRRRALVLVALLGVFLGVALVTWHPPLYTSTSKVLLPAAPKNPSGDTATWEASTQISIAESDAVLGEAAKTLSPPLSGEAVRGLVDVSAPTAEVLVITAHGRSTEAAAALAQAVAESEVEYQAEATSSLSAAERTELRAREARLQQTLDTVNGQIQATHDRILGEDPGSILGRRDATALAQLTAQQTDLVLQINELEKRITAAAGTSSAHIIEGASPADRPQLVLWYIIAGAGLALLAFFVALVVMFNMARRDAKLGARDEIADAVGSEVIASLRTQVPRTVAGWKSLLESYSPSVAEGWTLRLALTTVGVGDATMDHPGPSSGEAARKLLCVVSLTDDPRALSIGPQIASYAASIGISTMFVPEQSDATAALWAACSSQPGEEPVRENLRVSSRRRTKHPVELTVFATVLDRRAPSMPRLDRSSVVLVLAVSAGSASSEDLARTAVAAYESGFRIAGVLVADPDSLDKSTGRLLPHERLRQPPLPSRVTGPRPAALRDSSWTGGAS